MLVGADPQSCTRHVDWDAPIMGDAWCTQQMQQQTDFHIQQMQKQNIVWASFPSAVSEWVPLRQKANNSDQIVSQILRIVGSGKEQFVQQMNVKMERQCLWWRRNSRGPRVYTICPISDTASSQYANSYNSPHPPPPPRLYFYNSYESPPQHTQFTQYATIDKIFTQTESAKLFCCLQNGPMDITV